MAKDFRSWVQIQHSVQHLVSSVSFNRASFKYRLSQQSMEVWVDEQQDWPNSETNLVSLVKLWNQRRGTNMFYIFHLRASRELGPTSGQCCKHFMLVNYDSRVVIWGIFQSGTTLES